MGGVAIAAAWLLLSTLYYHFVHVPAGIHVWTNLICCAVAGAAIIWLSTRFMALKIYIVGFCAAIGLASLQVSPDQPTFSAQFLVFLTLHLTILGLFVALASLTPPLPRFDRPRRAFIADVAVFTFVAIGTYVALTKGVRLTGFLEGVRASGNLYKIAGLSGIQGMLSIFLLCSFSLLGPWKKVLFLVAVLLFAILDVKRGEFVRVAMFFAFFVAIVAPKKVVWVAILAAVTFIVFVLAGEARQGLYSAGFSVSDILNSRIDNTAFDWAYGYFGITVSVLQEYFNSPSAAAGYFPVLSSLVVNGPMPEISHTAIAGFNAGTVFSIFAGKQAALPTPDFFVFCALVGLMVASAVRLGTPSLMAFVLLQLFGFVFGNQLFLPYYLVGYSAAVAYQAVLFYPPKHAAISYDPKDIPEEEKGIATPSLAEHDVSLASRLDGEQAGSTPVSRSL